MHEINNYAPAEGSQVFAEWNASDVEQREVQTGFSIAATLLASAENYLHGMAELLYEPVAHFSYLAVGRACLENSARAWWLLDEAIGARNRAGRSLTERLSSLAEASSVMAAGGDTSDLLERNQRREAQVAQNARDQGFDVRTTKRGYVLTEFKRPNATDLCEMMLPKVGRFMYKILSASTHGTTYALMQHYRAEESDSGGLGWIVEPDNDFSMLGYTAAVVGLGFSKAGDRQIDLYGWDPKPWVSWKRHSLPLFRSLLEIVPTNKA